MAAAHAGHRIKVELKVGGGLAGVYIQAAFPGI